MREWVDELTGRAERASAGIRVPPEAEITQLLSMFPDLDRDVVVGALQRRYVLPFPCRSRGTACLNSDLVLTLKTRWRLS